MQKSLALLYAHSIPSCDSCCFYPRRAIVSRPYMRRVDAEGGLTAQLYLTFICSPLVYHSRTPQDLRKPLHTLRIESVEELGSSCASFV